MTRLGDLLPRLDARGLRDRPPTTAEWVDLLGELETALAETESLEELSATSVGDTVRLRHTLARTYTEVGDALALVGEAVNTFLDSTRGAGPEAVGTARSQFADWLGTSWIAQPSPEVPEDLEFAGAALRTLHQRLRGVVWVLGELVEEVGAQASAKVELARAGAVQRGLVPGPHTSVPGLDVYSWFEPAGHCAGDWWSAHALTEQDGLLVLGDVTGHGAPSAIVTGAIKGACDVARMGMRGALRPPQLLRMLNRILREATRDEFMMTGVVLRMQAGGGQGAISNAGHRAPLLVRNGQISPVQAVRDPPLGSTESHAYSEAEFEASPGDLLVLYTDGIPETENTAGAEFTEKSVRQLIHDHMDRGPAAVRDAIRQAVIGHRGGRPATDDVCLVIAQVI